MSNMSTYPYYKKCDVYCQTSEHEGYCTTITEAKLFNKPIVTTFFSGIQEQLKNYKAAIISKRDPFSFSSNIQIINREKINSDFNLEEKNSFLDFSWLRLFGINDSSSGEKEEMIKYIGKLMK